MTATSLILLVSSHTYHLTLGYERWIYFSVLLPDKFNHSIHYKFNSRLCLVLKIRRIVKCSMTLDVTVERAHCCTDSCVSSCAWHNLTHTRVNNTFALRCHVAVFWRGSLSHWLLGFMPKAEETLCADILVQYLLYWMFFSTN